jgi:hypothetical protein
VFFGVSGGGAIVFYWFVGFFLVSFFSFILYSFFSFYNLWFFFVFNVSF